MVQRLVDLAQLAQCDAQVVVGRGEVRPQLQRAAELLDGLGVPAQALQGRAQVAKRFGVIRPDRQGGAAAAGGPLELARRRGTPRPGSRVDTPHG